VENATHLRETLKGLLLAVAEGKLLEMDLRDSELEFKAVTQDDNNDGSSSDGNPTLEVLEPAAVGNAGVPEPDVTVGNVPDFNGCTPSGSGTAPETVRGQPGIWKATVGEVLRAAQSESVVLFLGESGSGKDYLARLLHDNSRRAHGPFFSINCAALVDELAESELFGHEIGAFTGAGKRKRGLVEFADGGTLLLNELGELSPNLQAKLLTFLDTQAFTRVGGETSVSVNARIVAATNRDLAQDVEAGRFRLDLYYRINVFPITVPPLRERLDDLPSLSRELLEDLCTKMERTEAARVDPRTMRRLRLYNWPGNVRELRNVLERALVQCEGKRIEPKHVAFLQPKQSVIAGDELSVVLRVSEHSSMKDQVELAKKQLVAEALRRARGNVCAAARMLGVSRDMLRHQIKVLGIDRPERG